MSLFNTKKGFFKAAANGDLAEISACLKAGYDINTADKDGVTALSHAARNGQLRALRLLLDKKADLEIADKKGATALLGAVDEGKTEAAIMLIAAGAAVNTHNDNYYYPLQSAAWHGDLDVVRALVDAGADLNTVIKTNGRTALHWAVDKEFGPIVELLMKAGARTDIANTEGKTAYDLAREKTPPRILNLMQALEAAAKTTAAAPTAAALAEGESWTLFGAASVAHVASSAALGRKLTTIFNFDARERLLITENLATRAETMGTPEKFETLPEDLLQRAEERLKELGGAAPAKKRLNL